MPSLMATHWVGQKTGPIFAICGPKYTELFAYAAVSAVCNAVFRLTMSCSVMEIFAITLQSFVKSCQNFDVFGPPNFGGRSRPNFWTTFINLGHHRTGGKVWWRSAKRPRRLGGEKKNTREELNYSGKTEWLAVHYESCSMQKSSSTTDSCGIFSPLIQLNL